MRKPNLQGFVRVGMVAMMLTTTFTACSTATSIEPSPRATAANSKRAEPPPQLDDCTLVSSSSPSSYVCNDKTYTSYELSKLRADYDAQNQTPK